MVQGILAGIFGSTDATELDVVDLTDSELVETIEGMGAYRKHRNYRRGISNFVRNISKVNKRNIVKIRPSDSKTMTGKAMFEKRISLIESDDIRKGLASGKYSIADFEVYSIKQGNSDTIDMFEASDDRGQGVTNINKGQLNNREAMLVTHITFQEGICASPTGDPKVDGATVDFKKITPNTANGDFNFKNGQKIFAERTSMDVFKVSESDGLRNGEVRLEVPKMIQEAKDVLFEVKMPALPVANTYFKVMLKGVIVVKA